MSGKPIKYIDPTGLYDVPGQKRKANVFDFIRVTVFVPLNDIAHIAKKAVFGGFTKSEPMTPIGTMGEMPARVFAGVAGADVVADIGDFKESLANKEYGSAAFDLAMAIPGVGAIKPIKQLDNLKGFKHVDTIADGAKASQEGFSSFRRLKKALGPAGDGKQWHHIVEQSQIKRSGFDKQLIHSKKNAIAINKELHKKISGFYSSKPRFAEGMTVRDWLAGKSFQEQYEFGVKAMKQFGVFDN